MPVCYGFARWSYGGDTVHAWRATVMPRNKPALFRSPSSRGCLKKLKQPGPLPCESRVYAALAGVATVWSQWVSETVATPGLKTGTVWTRLYRCWLKFKCIHLSFQRCTFSKGGGIQAPPPPRHTQYNCQKYWLNKIDGLYFCHKLNKNIDEYLVHLYLEIHRKLLDSIVWWPTKINEQIS